MTEVSTYVRKSGDRYEYGFVRRAKNFRKASDVYLPSGSAASVGEAETARAKLTQDKRHD